MSGSDDPLMERVVDLVSAAHDDTGMSGVVVVRLRHDSARRQVHLACGVSSLSKLNLVRAAEAILSVYSGEPGCDCAGCVGVRQALALLRPLLAGGGEVVVDGQPPGRLH